MSHVRAVLEDPVRGPVFPVVSSQGLTALCERGREAKFEHTLGKKGTDLLDTYHWHIIDRAEKLGRCWRCDVLLKLWLVDRPYRVTIDISEDDFAELALLSQTEMPVTMVDRLNWEVE